MSHFTVLVITDSADDLEGALAPFQENNMGDCPMEYMTFNPCQEEVETGWKEDTIECYILPDGRRHKRHSGLVLPAPYSDMDEGTLETEDVPVSQVYDSFENYVENYRGYDINPETGEYGYWSNPNAKWDWYQIGGRWTGFFKMKEGTEGETGEPGLFCNQPRPGYADQALKRNIDFEAMLADAEKQANETFDQVERVVAPYGTEIKPKTWRQVMAEYPPGDIDKAREAYHAQPLLKDLKEAKLTSWSACDIEQYHLHEEDSRAKFVADQRCTAFSTFAVLYEGEWYQKGEMGWFACVSDEKSKYDWAAQFMDILDSLPDDACLTVCDCHI